MKNIKKVLAVVLSVILALSCLTIISFAEEPAQPGTSDDTGITLTPEQQEELSQVGDDMRDMMDDGFNLLSYINNLLQAIRDFFAEFAETLHKITTSGALSGLFGDIGGGIGGVGGI